MLYIQTIYENSENWNGDPIIKDYFLMSLNFLSRETIEESPSIGQLFFFSESKKIKLKNLGRETDQRWRCERF